MLGKLIKYEWKDVYKLSCIIILAIFAVTLLGCVLLRTPIMTSIFAEEAVLSEVQEILFAFTSVSSLMVYILLLVGAVYGIIIYMGVHFYKTMYTDQGYLTHTLPVKAHQILFSKVFVSGIWILFVYLAVFLSIIALVVAAAIGIAEGTGAELSFAAFWDEMMLIWNELDLNSVHMCIIVIIEVLITPFMAVILMFGALTIGQLSRKHKLLMGILTYFGIVIANSIIGALVETIITLYYSIKNVNEFGSGYVTSIYDSALIISCAMGIIFYFVTHLIISKKLNMN